MTRALLSLCLFAVTPCGQDAPQGRIAFLEGNHLCVVGTDGKGKRVLTEAPGIKKPHAYCYDHAWSPDGSRIAFATDDMRRSVHALHVMDAGGGGHRVLSRDLFVLYWGPTLAWSPDGRRIAFVGRMNYAASKVKVGLVSSSGRDTRETVLWSFDRREKGWTAFSVAWSPAGDVLALAAMSRTGSSIILLPVAGGERRVLVETASRRCHLAWSPDGRWLACTSAGRIRVVEVGTAAGRELVEGLGPLWSRDGRTLLFLRQTDEDGRYAVWQMEGGGGRPRQLTPADVALRGRPFFSLSPDGAHLVYADLHGRIWRVETATRKRTRLLGTGKHRGPAWQPAKTGSRGKAGRRGNPPQ